MRRKEFVAVLAATMVIAGGVICLSSVSMRAEADRRQRIYDEAVAINQQREADRLKAEEPYRLEAEQQKKLVEQANADAKEAETRAKEAFANAIREHPIPDAFMAPSDEEASDEESSEEEASEEESSDEEASEEEPSDEEALDEEASEEEASDEESSDEESSEEEYPEEETSEEEPSDEETLYDVVASTTALQLTTEERNFALRVYAAESGDYNSDEFLIANAWLLRNAIEYYDGDVWAALTPNAYQVVGSDGEVRGAEGVVTLQMAMESDRIYSIFNAVMDGEIPSPIENYTCGLPYDVWGYESGYMFAVDYGITECSVVDNGVYFPAECWTEALTELLMNT